MNALEYVKIPEMQANIKYITMKLDENERSNTIRLMKVKDMLLKESIEEKRAEDARALRDFRAVRLSEKTKRRCRRLFKSSGAVFLTIETVENLPSPLALRCGFDTILLLPFREKAWRF